MLLYILILVAVANTAVLYYHVAFRLRRGRKSRRPVTHKYSLSQPPRVRRDFTALHVQQRQLGYKRARARRKLHRQMQRESRRINRGK